jgi:hypothetical protein
MRYSTSKKLEIIRLVEQSGSVANSLCCETGLKRRTGLPDQGIKSLSWTQLACHPQLAFADHMHELHPSKGCRS